MSIITKAAKRFDKQVVQTVCELALEVCDAVRKSWSELDMETAMVEAKAITADYPKASQAPRTTEWKDFVFAAANHNLAGAIREAKKSHNVTRVALFALAKKLRTADSSTAAIKAVFAAKVKGKGRTATIGMGLGIIKNLQTKERNVIAFRKALAELCAKHGITY